MYNENKRLSTDGTKLLIKQWIPDEGAPKAKVIIIHGKGEHSGRYHELAEYLMNSGVAVYALDLRGHGQSGSPMGHCAPRKKVLEDINFLVRIAAKETPEGPLFVLGHSMGGNIALHHRMLFSEGVSGYIISAPWLKLYTPQPAALVFLVSLLSPIIGGFVTTGKIDNTTITSVPEELKLLNEDKVCHPKISFATFHDVMKATKKIYASASSTKVPMLLVHGSGDTLIDPEGSRKLAELSEESVTYVEFPDSRHEIHHDFDKAREFELIVAYIEEYNRKKS